MNPLTLGLFTGGASLLGSLFSSDTSAKNTQANIQAQREAQQATQDFNAEQAAINRNFQAGQISQQEGYQTQMSNTAYQRASMDMKQAGLNPMMMFGSGSAASAPTRGGAGGSAPTASTPNKAPNKRTSPPRGPGA